MAMNHLLNLAAERGDANQVVARLDAGDDINGRHKGTGRTPLLQAVIAGHCGVVELLLARGADPTVSCTAVGETALGWAVTEGHADIVRVLLAHGADPNGLAANSFLGRTPVMFAAMMGITEVLQLLLDAGGDPMRMDNRGDNALALAEQDREEATAALLRERGATLPEAKPPWAPIPWPALAGEPTDPERFTDPIPDDASPAQVVRSYVLATHTWETTAWQEMAAARMAGERFDGVAHDALKVAHTIRDIHCTARERRYARASIGAIPDLTPDFALVEETQPNASRRELLLRHPQPEHFVHKYEWLFVCMRKGGRWRIDSAKHRLLGIRSWEPAIL